MIRRVHFLFIICLSWCMYCSAVEAEVIRMGYRTNERQPLIDAAPDNSGLYFDLYTLAASKIGCSLEVIRKPKKRIIEDLKAGLVDFYPGFNFTFERANYTYYAENGLPGGDVGISRPDLPDVTHLNQLQGQTMISALGGPNFLANISGVNERRIPEMTIEKAIQLIRLKRDADFYIYNKSSIEFHLKQHNITDIKIHPDCYGGIVPLYLGFSKKSALVNESLNPNYDAGKEKSIDNCATMLDPSCTASRLVDILRELKQDGETQKLYDKYYK